MKDGVGRKKICQPVRLVARGHVHWPLWWARRRWQRRPEKPSVSLAFGTDCAQENVNIEDSGAK